MKKTISGAIVSAVLLMAVSSVAAPLITSIVLNNGAMSITSTGQGDKIQAAPFLYDDFEGKNIGDSINGGKWLVTSTHPPTYSNDTAPNQNSEVVAKFYSEVIDGASDANTTWVDDVTTTGQNIYINMWMWFDHGDGTPLDGASKYQVKNFRIHNGSSSLNSWTNSTPIFAWGEPVTDTNNYYVPCAYAGDCQPVSPSNGSTSMPQASVSSGDLYSKYWYNVTMALTQASATDVYDAKLVLQVSYKNYQQKYFVGNLPDVGQTFTNVVGGSAYYRGVQFQNYIHANSGSTTTYYDDVYIDNTLQRVEVGDNPVYSECTHREIQIPTAWSNTEIAATVRQGSFPDGGYYVFVVDADNVPSAGYPITLGSIRRRSMGTRQGTGSFR